MKPKKRQKMCYNCEGEVDLDVIVCPFCAADLRAEKPEQQYPAYNPASSVKALNPAPVNTQTSKSLYPPAQAAEEEAPQEQEAVLPMEEASESEGKTMIGPTILLALGVQLALFGLMMALFSSKGVFVLKWDARLWFLYLLASAPLIIFGYRALSKL